MQTLKASTEASNKNLIMFGQRNSITGSGTGEFKTCKAENGREVFRKVPDLLRVRSGVPVPHVPLVKVKDQKRQETLSPFDEIPITSSKKARDLSRPATGIVYPSAQNNNQSSQNLANKPSAQTLLA